MKGIIRKVQANLEIVGWIADKLGGITLETKLRRKLVWTLAGEVFDYSKGYSLTLRRDIKLSHFTQSNFRNFMNYFSWIKYISFVITL